MSFFSWGIEIINIGSYQWEVYWSCHFVVMIWTFSSFDLLFLDYLFLLSSWVWLNSLCVRETESSSSCCRTTLVDKLCFKLVLSCNVFLCLLWFIALLGIIVWSRICGISQFVEIHLGPSDFQSLHWRVRCYSNRPIFVCNLVFFSHNF